ncbi:MAG TPA: hypothetical protein VKT52_00055, partial [Ktedonobacterales bacterium]|nr:hypothetical protein [Ktedonobacterales bacterium]
MDGQEHRPPDDELDSFSAEVSDLRPPLSAEAPPPTRALFELHTRRQRNTRLVAVVCAGLLALAVILASNPGLRTRALALIPDLATTPTATAAPDNSLFYLLPNPPGVDVTVDGHLLSHLPLPEYGQPLHLAPGAHVFTWRSQLLPFVLLNCRVSVPRAKADTCPLIAPDRLPPSLADLRGSVIGMHVSMSALDSTPPSARLPTVIQLALDTLSSTATVQPGEWYLSSSDGQSAVPVKATQPLRATRRLSLVTDPAYPEPCTLSYPAIPCRFDGQS